jgi:peptide/nickel transport system permease protein
MLAPVLVGVSIFCFLLIRVLPGDPILSIVPETATQADIDRTRAQYGLDRPLVEQYGAYMVGVVQGDFGNSIQTNRPIVEQIVERLPRTLELVVLGFLLALIMAIILGLFAARNAGRIGDHLARVGALVANSLPEFWLGLVLILVFFAALGIAPGPTGRISSGIDFEVITGSLIIDSIITGNMNALVSTLHHLMLPVLTLGIIVVAPMMRSVRASALQVMQSESYRCATAHGLRPNKLLYGYLLRETMVRVPTLAALVLGNLIGGSVLVEFVFSWQGFGQWALRGLLLRDYPVIQAYVLVTASFYVVAFLVADVVQAALDPRIRV